jgi:hypothetical protein
MPREMMVRFLLAGAVALAVVGLTIIVVTV